MSAAINLAERIQAQANGLMTPEQARHVWLMVATLQQEARNTEQQAFLAMRELQDGQAASAADFCKFTRESLAAIHRQLKAISGVLNAK